MYFAGVADLDSLSPDLKSTSGMDSKGRPLSTAKNYDYADYQGHQYEELPRGYVYT